MPYATTRDSVQLYFEEAGSGTPIIFVHEFAADYASWEPQMRYFSGRHRCIHFASSATRSGSTTRRARPTPCAASRAGGHR